MSSIEATPTEGAENNEEQEIKIPTAGEGKSEEVYEIKEIVEYMLSRKGFFLKVRWEGYGPEEDSWEPEEDLRECASDIVDEFIRGRSAKERKAIEDFKKKAAEKKKEGVSRRGRKSKSSEAKTPSKVEYRDDDDDEDESDEEKVPKKKTRKSRAQEESDYSDSNETTPMRPRRKATGGPSSSTRRKKQEEKSSVLTKAAVKSYCTPSTAKKAALRHRHTFLGDLSDSSDDEKEYAAMSFDDEIRAKVKSVKKKMGNEISATDETPITKSASRQPMNGESSSWIVEGIAQKKSANDNSKIVLLKNNATGEKKVLSDKEAYALAGWNFCEYLLDRCFF
ncbi:unnamed protein product [Caenorhabditis bovis]|uniref:Chromo domain-containing protein n=1 Tax=Caenorhabditis bovis TaxID=2654633 RepID=A0A8S1EW53_9PELO|nr:unnamed protein product [Caenorhabditis bovis]